MLAFNINPIAQSEPNPRLVDWVGYILISSIIVKDFLSPQEEMPIHIQQICALIIAVPLNLEA